MNARAGEEEWALRIFFQKMRIIKPMPQGELGGFGHTVGALLSLSSSLSSLSYTYTCVCTIQSANRQGLHSSENKWGMWEKKGRDGQGS